MLRPLGLLIGLAGCAAGPGATEVSAPPDFEGLWRAELASPGGPLPFGLTVHPPGAQPPATMHNAEEAAPFSSVTVEGATITLETDWYDSRIVATLEPKSGRLVGEWTKRSSKGWSRLAFTAARSRGPRFAPDDASKAAPGAEQVAEVAGVWKANFKDEDGPFVAQGEFRQADDRVEGTFLTATGDYRFLEGTYRSGWLRLSSFDGAHAFLFVARATADGRLVGDFWSRDTYHATWEAERVEDDVLPDPYGLSSITNEQGRLTFSFPDRNGRQVSLQDARFANKVVLVDIFGTWCPNCNDQTPLLVRWHQRYRDRGFEIIGLAYELSGDPDRDRRQIEIYRERYGIEFPLLLSGVSDKKAAGSTLPDLSEVVAYPTTIFVGRDGRVRKIHTGFAGPGTGEHYRRLVEEFESEIERLLAEAGPSASAAHGRSR